MRAFVVFSYYCGVDAMLYWLNRRAKRVIVFHNVLPDHMADKSGGGMSLSEFMLIMREVGKRFSFSTDLLDPKTATLTFDDGYLNQYEVVFNALKPTGAKCCVFVGGGQKPFVIDQLMHWVNLCPTSCLSGMSRNEFWSKVIYPKYEEDACGRGAAALKMCEDLYPMKEIWAGLGDEYIRLRLMRISEEQINEMRSSGWVVGWHTKSHFPLSKLSAQERREELTPPTSMAGCPMAYPYGSDVQTGRDSVMMARELGFPFALANIDRTQMSFSRHYFPRIHLPSDKYRLHYVLSGLQCFLLEHRLLPVIS